MKLIAKTQKQRNDKSICATLKEITQQENNFCSKDPVPQRREQLWTTNMHFTKEEVLKRKILILRIAKILREYEVNF